MGMHIHELHAASVHAPLVLIPAAAAIDLSAALTGNKNSAALGRRLWWLGLGAGALAGIAGLAASQEVKADDPASDDMIWLHGVGNFTLLLGGAGMALWRAYHPPTVGQAALGLGASALAAYTAYLGGEMVYGQGIGVRAMSRMSPNGVRRSPPVMSAAAPGAFLRDAVAGFSWLLGRTARALGGRQSVDRGAFGIDRLARVRDGAMTSFSG